jgi:Zn-dependent M28 family amino/carboxypeptidase
MDYTKDAPGSDDDATGVAVVMEMARVVAKMGRPKATMIFAATAGEEQALYGSAHLAQTLKNASVNGKAKPSQDIQSQDTSDLKQAPPSGVSTQLIERAT